MLSVVLLLKANELFVLCLSVFVLSEGCCVDEGSGGGR